MKQTLQRNPKNQPARHRIQKMASVGLLLGLVVVTSGCAGLMSVATGEYDLRVACEEINGEYRTIYRDGFGLGSLYYVNSSGQKVYMR